MRTGVAVLVIAFALALAGDSLCFPSEREIEAFLRDWPAVPSESRTKALTRMLLRLRLEDDNAQLERALRVDEAMIADYARTRDLGILAAYAAARKGSLGSAAYRPCAVFEAIWEIDHSGATISREPAVGYLLENCPTGRMWGMPIRLTPPADGGRKE